MSRYRQSMREALQEVSERNEVIDEALKWEVKVTGLPMFYVDAKGKGQVRQMLRKLLKRPDDVVSIERKTSTEVRKIRRGQARGDEPGESNEEVEDAFDYKAKKGAIAAPGSGSIAKAKKPKATDVNKSIEQQMKDALKEQIKSALKEKATINADQVVNMIQFGHPFKVVDEEIPPELPGPETRRYANVSNAVVDKADKKSNKAMAKAQKDTLVPTQTKEEVEIDEGPPTPKFKPLRHKVWSADASIPAGARPKDPGKIPKYKVKKSGMGSGAPINIKAEYDHTSLEDVVSKVMESEWKDMSDQQKKAKAKSQFDAILKKKLGNPKDYDSPIKVREQEGGVTDDSGYTRYPSTGNWAGIKGKTYKRNLAKAQAKDKKDQNKNPVGKIRKENLETWLEDSEWAQEKRKEKESSERLLKIHKEREARYQMQQRKKREAAAKKKVSEVAPPGWGHTKAEKEKTKPDKPKSKIGGSAHEFQKDLDSGKFKGLPGDKTYKDKKASMFKLMWSMKNKGDKPHYKPGVKDQLKKKYKDESVLDSAKRYLNEKADWNTAFKSAAQSRPPMKYKDAVSFIDTAGLNSREQRSALKAAKKWLR